jgi:hypothetical protein
MKFTAPAAMIAEHEELHADLARAIKSGGRTAEAAKAVAKVLHEHFLKEEEFAIPPLSLLVPLAKGEFQEEMAQVLTLTDKLEADLPQMLSEHQAVVRALSVLAEAARGEGKPEVEKFAQRLQLHAQTEEQLSYPAAILVGRYVRSRLQAKGAT